MRDLLLLFAYHFPPENSIGGARPYRFYKYLSRMGVRCRVFTAVDLTTRQDLDAESVADPFITKPRQGLGWQFERALRRFFMPGVNGTQWGFLAAKAAARFLATEYPGNPSDLRITLLSTFPPLGTPLAAYLLARKMRSLRRRAKWIADFRDPLAGNPGGGDLTAFHRFCFRQCERIVAHSADALIANTDVAQRKLQSSYPAAASRIHLLWNGFDPENRILPLPLPERPRRTYSHVGELYEGRTMAPILHSIARLIQSGRLDPNRLQIQQIGPVRAGCLAEPAFNREAESQGWLRVLPQQLPQPEAQAISQQSDGLLLIQNHSAVQVPGKLFEYIQIGRPILAFIPPNSPVEPILQQSGAPFQTVYANSNPDEIDKAVHRYFQTDSAPVKPSPWFDSTFNGEQHAHQLYQWIQAVHS